MARSPKKQGGEAARLDTPTDLGDNETKAVAEAVNGLLADAFALYLKTKNYHWHISGPNFRDYHEMLDEQAAEILATTDPLAERVRKIGQTTLRSIGQISKITNIEDDDRDVVPPRDMLLQLLGDNKAMAHAMREAHEVCDEAGDVATASLLEEYIDATEKRIWFLFEATRAAEQTGH
ncbi:MAG TPA: DNA starvation/stationary phase protection protein [Beijerinckiaceae bacterium]